MDPRTTIERFDRLLAERGLTLDAVVMGGTALALLGVITRHTEDCDIIHPELPPDVLQAARDLAAADPDLSGDWLNNGPASITAQLPWLEYQDANPDWPAHVRSAMADLQRRLNDGV